MRATTLSSPSRLLRIGAAVLAAALALPGQARAQTVAAPPSPAAVPVPQQGAEGPSLAISMDQAVEMALEANLGLRADRAAVDIASHAVAAARASFLPQVASSVSRSSSRSVPQDFTQGAADITSQGLVVTTSFAQSLPLFGTRYDLSWNSNRNTQIGGNPLFNPSMRSSFAFNLTQPLLRGLTIDQSRASLRASESRRAIADVQLQQQIVRLEATVRSAYLDLISAHEALRVAQQNMDVRQRSLADARARVAVGAAAPIDVISAEADVASNQEQVLLAEAQIAAREDALRALTLDPARPDFWQVRIVPTDTIEARAPSVDVQAATAQALANRYDLTVARRELEIDDLLLRAGRNAARPGVDLRVSYGTTGTGGTRFTYGDGFPPPVVSRSDKGFGAVLGDTFGAAYPQWTLGLNLSYPIGQSAAEASYAQQVVARRQAALTLQQLELAVVQQVREAARQVENSYQRVIATQAALRASEQQFEAEQRRFAAGLATTLELQVRQGQLASARTAGLNAAIAYQRALIEFDRVQKSQ